VILVLSKISVLPRRTLPYIIAAFAGLFGFALWREYRIRGLRKELELREAELKKREEKLAALKESYLVSERELQKITAELDAQKAAYQKSMLQIDARTEEEKKAIDQLYGEPLQDKFSSLLDRLDSK
jgi:septal ring factor EnvC (AmiA/AmiB activator)